MTIDNFKLVAEKRKLDFIMSGRKGFRYTKGRFLIDEINKPIKKEPIYKYGTEFGMKEVSEKEFVELLNKTI